MNTYIKFVVDLLVAWYILWAFFIAGRIAEHAGLPAIVGLSVAVAASFPVAFLRLAFWYVENYTYRSL